MVADTEELENLDASKMLEDSMRKRSSCRKMLTQMEQSNYLDEIRFSENAPQSRITLHEAKSITDWSQPLDTITDDRSPKRFYIDLVRRTNTTLDVLLESRIDDYRIVDGGRDLSELWTGFTQFTKLNEKTSRRIHVVPEAADKNSSNIKTRSFLARNVVRNVESSIRLLKNRSSTMLES